MIIDSSISLRNYNKLLGGLLSALFFFPLFAVAEANPPAWRIIKSSEMVGSLPLLDDQVGSGTFQERFEELAPIQTARRKVLFQNALTSTLFEAQYSSTRSFDFPADEVVYVVSGASTFTDEPSGRKTTMRAGDLFVVPRHWRGVWTMHRDGGKPFRELTAFSTYDWAIEKPMIDHVDAEGMLPSSVIKIELLSSAGNLEELVDEPGRLYKNDPRPVWGRVLFNGNPVLRMYEAPEGAVLRKEGSGCDALIHIMKGGLLVVDESGRQSEIATGEAIILKANFQGRIKLGEEFQGTVAAILPKDVTSVQSGSGSAKAFCPQI